MKTFYAWAFASDKLRDGSPLPKVGKWEHYEGKLELCAAGLHWSRDPFDALQHAEDSNLRRVEIKGDFLEQADKGCSHYRRTVYQFDATELLRYFARMQALSVIHLYPNDKDDVVFDYLMTGDESLRDAARAAALAAAGASAWDAAQAAAGAAAWAASRAAAWSAAWAAAWDFARAAARAAGAAGAAGAAAWDSAWDFARAAARKDFNKLVRENK
jgi:hypothetical protein